MRFRPITVILVSAGLALWIVVPAQVAAHDPDTFPTRRIGAVSVSAGGEHLCAVTTAGDVRCWGANYAGQLGDGTIRSRPRPVDVVGTDSNFVAVAAGGAHTCALTDAGGVRCWGANDEGQLGDGTTRRRLRPVEVVGLSGGVAAVTAGPFHSCALTDAGGVKCWGRNSSGQLGDGTAHERLAPVDVAGLDAGARAVAVGGSHSCALTAAGGVACWGGNDHGQLGDGTRQERHVPVGVVGLETGVASIGAGWDSSYALTDGGAVMSWGANDYGQLGDGTRRERHVPVGVVGLETGVASIGPGWDHACASTESGGARCWGFNAHGQLGDGTERERHVPVDVVGLEIGTAAIAAGGAGTCALSDGGAVRAWGERYVGDGTAYSRTIPITVRGLGGTDPAGYRPDASLRLMGTGTWIGEGVLDRTGEKQTVAAVIPRGTMTIVRIRLGNDGDTRDQFLIEGTVGTRRIRVEYLSGTRTLTRGVRFGRAWFELVPGERAQLRIRVRATTSARIGSELIVLLRDRSSHRSGRIDVVRVSVTVA
jgi:alpha-tubulin suppressor-like RCC1 family protein